MDHGSGGGATARLIEELLVPAFANEQLSALGDGAVLDLAGPLVFSTDSFVIDPIFFPGGDIGKLAVCGTVNDLAMCGGTPKYLSLSFILEEGFPVDSLKKIITSIAETAASCGVAIVTGDTMDYLWILARTENISHEELALLLRLLREWGFEPNLLQYPCGIVNINTQPKIL
jgi:hydrogenase expression/formation protein HypE